MNDQWLEFLAQRGASISEDGLALFPDSTSKALTTEESQTTLCYLQSQGMLAIQGPDSATFLQGQLSCDLNQINDQYCTLGAYCTPQGRMVASFRIGQWQADSYLLRMQTNILASTEKVLGKYIVFSKAKISDRSQDFVLFGLSGPQSKEALQQLNIAQPMKRNQLIKTDEMMVMQLDDVGERFELWVQNAAAQQAWINLSPLSTLVDERFWHLLNIRAGIGGVEANTVEMFIPQMLNYDLIDGVSFNKGCYTGQEIIARMHYRGTPKKRLFRAKAHHDKPLIAGQPLYSASNQQSVGNIVLAQALTEQESELLAVINLEAHEKDEILLMDKKDSSKLQTLALPYAIT